MPEILANIAESEYHATTGVGPGKWVTRSLLRDYLDSPSACRARLDGVEPFARRPQNDGMRFGSLFEAVACGREIEEYPATCEDAKGRPVPWSLRYQSARDWIGAHPLAAAAEDVARARILAARFSETLPGREFLRNLERADQQLTLRWTERGVDCQARVDVYLRGAGGRMYDVKTSSSPLHRFGAVALQYGYDLQAAHYAAGASACRLPLAEPMLFAVAQTTWPFLARIVTLPLAQLEDAERRRIDALDGIAAGVWSCDEDRPYEPPLPRGIDPIIDDEEIIDE